MLVSTAIMSLFSKSATVWNRSFCGTPRAVHASRYAAMFSICLNGIFDEDGALQQPSEILLASVHSTVPSLSSSCNDMPPSAVPVTASIQPRASASIPPPTSAIFASAFAARSWSIP